MAPRADLTNYRMLSHVISISVNGAFFDPAVLAFLMKTKATQLVLSFERKLAHLLIM